MEKDKIIIVDDDAANRKLLEEALKPIGASFFLASTAQSALNRIKEEKPDLLISDVNMPGMDGFQLTKALRKNDETRDIPIILVTGMNARDLKMRGLQAGCDDFVHKPYDLSELQVRVRTMLRLSHYRRQLTSKRQLDFIFDQISDGLIITDKNYKIIRINKTAEKYLNTSITGKNLVELFEQQYEKTDPRDDIFNSQHTDGNCIYFRPATDTTSALYLHCKINWVKNEQRGENRALLILKDVTGEQTEQRLKYDFISLISHKLRSPLSVIGGLSQLLEKEMKGAADQDQLNIFSDLKTNTIRLELLVDKLIRFSTINNINLIARQSNPFEPLVTAKNAVKHTIYYYGKKTIRTEYNSSLNPNYTLSQITEEQFTFIIENLVENAIKFSSPRGVEILLNFSQSEKKFIFSVSDNGPGIPPEVQDKIFDSFYQYEKIFTGNVEGMGIGLAMVKHLVGQYGGEISVKSQLNHGTTFFITIPIF